MPHWQSLFSVLRENEIHVSDQDMPRPVAGGDISSAWRVNAIDQAVFLKTGPISAYEMFLAEADGLRELARANAIRVPQVLGCVTSSDQSVLALEWIDFELPTPEAESMLGARLATQHRTRAERFGWRQNNWIGSTPQQNTWNNDWVEFFTEHRLLFQLDLAARNGYTGALQVDGQRLLNNVGRFFNGYWPEASLLHGDLWSGNWATSGGEPVIFDPATYYGDRESDIAMTKLFGGFSRAFYDAYEDAWPLADGAAQRQLLYQLYHVLNHLNLFGTAYLSRAEKLTRKLL